MTREIKFRAWDLDNEKYEYDIAIRPINGIIGIEIYNNEMYPVEFRGLVEQYTGLKDKNSKEIYEGDIAKDQRGYIGQIIWFENEAGFGFDEVHETGFSTMPLSRLILEVIGNIHENPELLGGEE